MGVYWRSTSANMYRGGHPPTETMRDRISPLGVDRHDVPLTDHGRCGGTARQPERPVWPVLSKRSSHLARPTERAAGPPARRMTAIARVLSR